MRALHMLVELHSRQPRRHGDRWRIRFFGGLTFLVWLVFVARLAELQVLEHASYAREAELSQRAIRVTRAERGEIFYSSNRPFAINENVFTVYAVTRDMEPGVFRTVAERLSPLVNQSVEDLRALFEKSPSARYVPIASSLPRKTEHDIRKLNLKGIGSFAQSIRFYPDGKRIGTLSGFLGWEGVGSSGSDRKVGRYGVEEYNEDILAGLSGSAESERDAKGAWVPIGERVIAEPVHGTDLVLTIDETIQSVSCTKLQETAKRVGADRGSVLVLDPKSGGIVSLCTLPSYDPNAYAQVKHVSDFRNNAIAGSYEPGSVFKIMTMALGIEAGVVEPETTYVDTGSVVIGPDVIRNARQRVYKKQTMIGVLENSINTGAVFVARKLGAKRFRDGVNAFGFGRATGVELAAEALGDTSSLESSREIYMATGSFGQGISATPVQLASAFGTIANGGVLLRPTIIKEQRLPNGKRIVSVPTVIRRVLSEHTAALMRGMMVSVVRNGHAKRAGVKGYLIGGKTGTAQVARKDGKGYSDETMHTFVGMGPMDAPRFVLVVTLDNPKAVEFADSSAAPLAGELAQFLLEYWKIPPSE